MKSQASVFCCLFACAIPSMADPASKLGSMNPKSPQPPAAPEYLSESPLPEGWPQPGPFNSVVRKNYPAYRAAFTAESSPNGGFWRLFKHIERHGIPMTAPVEMRTDAESGKMEEMAFIYQNKQVGKTGADEGHVEVRDVPAREALSYAWQGPRSDASIAKARAAIEAELAARNLKTSGYRLLGYNSPFVPLGKQTHELQALLP
jgi:hypothetical protein